jgi:hypothetical protein
MLIDRDGYGARRIHATLLDHSALFVRGACDEQAREQAERQCGDEYEERKNRPES